MEDSLHCWFLRIVKVELPYDAAIPCLDTYPNKTVIQNGTCTPCSQQHYSQQSIHGNSLNAHWQMNGWRCGTYMRQNITQPWKEQSNAICRNTNGTMLSRVSRTQMSYDIPYTWNLKYDTNKPIYETETDTQTWKTHVWWPRGWAWRREGMGGWG